ncbi:MAG: alpha/beta fold hydrolase [Deltaproteobacteria bacterium]
MAERQVNGVRLHVQRLGEGPRTVVFLHGLVMDNLSSFYFTLASPVAKRAQAILFDLRGHGRSERPSRGYSLDAFLADLDALVKDLGLMQPVHLVGNSFGGLLALAYAARRPAAVASLFLLDAHLGATGWGDAMVQTLGLRGDERDKRIAESFQHWLGRNSERKRNRLALGARALVEGTSLLPDLAASPALTPEALGSIGCPTLALYGERSDLRAQAEALPDAMPHARLVVRPGCTHSLLWEDTAWVREELLSWLSGQP